ncbi:hypothetical protein BDY24DRAFT_381412 [Mrakia frigida]|uniref:uncharacterized protein n=1 Tax=Mrakia frigida TaxID=29902 RepID=UPI003FCC24CD
MSLSIFPRRLLPTLSSRHLLLNSSASHLLSKSHRFNSSSPAPEEDDDPLSYHPFPPLLALSFLPYPPHSVNSKTILGWLPLADGADLNSFKENPAFRDVVLDRTVRESLEEGEERISNEAQGRKEGWVHVHDDRNYPMPGRIGDPSDLIGSVYVQDGEIQPKTYTAMPSYRILTGDGPTKLSDGMHKKLLEVLKRIHEEEGRTGVDASS